MKMNNKRLLTIVAVLMMAFVALTVVVNTGDAANDQDSPYKEINGATIDHITKVIADENVSITYEAPSTGTAHTVKLSGYTPSNAMSQYSGYSTDANTKYYAVAGLKFILDGITSGRYLVVVESSAYKTYDGQYASDLVYLNSGKTSGIISYGDAYTNKTLTMDVLLPNDGSNVTVKFYSVSGDTDPRPAIADRTYDWFATYAAVPIAIITLDCSDLYTMIALDDQDLTGTGWTYTANGKVLTVTDDSSFSKNTRFDGYRINLATTTLVTVDNKDSKAAAYGFAIKSRVSANGTSDWSDWIYSTHISDLMGTTYNGAPWTGYWTTTSPYLTVVSISDDVDDRNWSAKVDSAGDSMQNVTFYCTWDLNSKKYTASSFDGSVVKNKSMSLVRNCEYTIKDGTINSSVTRNSVPDDEYFGYLLFQTYGKVTFSNLTLDVHSVSVPAYHGIAAIATKAGEGAVNIQSCDILTRGNADDYAVVASWYADKGGWYTIAPVVNITNTAQQTVNGNIAAGMYTTSQVTPSIVPTLNLVSGAVDGDIVTAIFSENDATYTGTNNYKVTVGEGATVTGKLSVSKYGIVENNGTIIVNGASTIDGVLTNKGTINNSGTITVSDKGRINVLGSGIITKGDTSSQNGIMSLSTQNVGGAFSLVVFGGVVAYQDIELVSTATHNESPISLNNAESNKGPVTFAHNNVTMKGSRAILVYTNSVSSTDNKLVSVNNNVFTQYGYDSTTADPAVKIEACIQIGESTNCEWSGVGLKISLTNNTFNIKTFDEEKDKPISVLSKATIGSDISNSDLVISNGSDVIFKGTEQITSDISLHDLWIKEGATVTVNSGKALTITGKLTNDATLTIAGTVNNGGTILNKVNRVIKIDGGTITKSGSTNGTFDIDSTAAGSVLLISGTIEYQNIDLVAGSVSQIWVSHDRDGDGSRGNATIQNNSITLNGTYGILLQVMENKDKPSVLLSVNNNVFNAQGTNAAKWFVQVGSGEGQTIAEGISISIRNNSIADGSKAMDTSSPEYKPIKVLAKDRVKGSATENITVGTSDAILMISLDSSIGFRTSGVVSFVSDIILSDLGAYAGTTIVAKDACVRINGDAVVTNPLSTVDDGKYIVTPTSTYTVNSKKIVGAAAGYRLTLTSGIAEISTVNDDNSSIVLKGDGTVNVDYALESGDVFAVENGSVLTVDAGQTLEVKTGASLVNNGTIDVKGILTDNFIVTTSSEIIDNNGVINVKNGGQLKVGYYNPEAGTPGINIAGTIVVYNGAKLLNKADAENTLIGEGGQVVVTNGKVSIDAYSVGGRVDYTLDEYSAAIINQTYFGFKAGDAIYIEGSLTADNLVLVDGVGLYIGGYVNVPQNKKLTVEGSAQIYIASEGELYGGGTVDFTATASNSIVITAEQGALFTVTLDGSTGTDADKKYSAIILDKIVAGSDGFTISKGSVIINGYYTTDAEGTITIPAKDELGNPNVAYISGNVDSDVTIKVAGEAKLEVATGSSLTFEAGSALVGKITVEKGSASEVIYEEGSVVNGAVIEVTTRETEEGVQVTVTITLRTENGDKLMLYYEGEYCEVIFIEAFQGDKFVDILANVGVEPVKSRVSFDGWYNVLNEKVTSGMEVGSVAPTLTAKFTETPREGVTPHTPSIEPTVITVDETSGYDNTTMLVAAVAMLVVAIFVLGFVVLKKRN